MPCSFRKSRPRAVERPLGRSRPVRRGCRSPNAVRPPPVRREVPHARNNRLHGVWSRNGGHDAAVPERWSGGGTRRSSRSWRGCRSSGTAFVVVTATAAVSSGQGRASTLAGFEWITPLRTSVEADETARVGGLAPDQDRRAIASYRGRARRAGRPQQLSDGEVSRLQQRAVRTNPGGDAIRV